jgi:hypothetical protein
MKIIFWNIRKNIKKLENIKNKVAIEIVIGDNVVSSSDVDLSQINCNFEQTFKTELIVIINLTPYLELKKNTIFYSLYLKIKALSHIYTYD